jgi:CCR4-NOT transcription complex subunit 1
MFLISREQAIFNCMISNLFEEYKFFTKYPDKQLKLAAVLFGMYYVFALLHLHGPFISC